MSDASEQAGPGPIADILIVDDQPENEGRTRSRPRPEYARVAGPCWRYQPESARGSTTCRQSAAPNLSQLAKASDQPLQRSSFVSIHPAPQLPVPQQFCHRKAIPVAASRMSSWAPIPIWPRAVIPVPPICSPASASGCTRKRNCHPRWPHAFGPSWDRPTFPSTSENRPRPHCSAS